MSSAESSGEAPVFPRVIDMVMRVIPARIVADPLITSYLDVGSIRVTLTVVVMGLSVLPRRSRLVSHRSRTARRNVPTANFQFSVLLLLFPFSLPEQRYGQQKTNCE